METALEKKYGKNDLTSLIICPRCADAVLYLHSSGQP
jgi:hypothetical protein